MAYTQRKARKVFTGDDYLEQTDIKSHTSMLTNRRLDYFMQYAMNLNYTAFTSPSIENVQHFFSLTRTIYDSVFFIFNDEENKKLVDLRNKIYKDLFLNDWKGANQTGTALNDIIKIFFNVEEFFCIIQAYLQKRNYWFRVGEAERKGINTAIKIFEDKGGIFERSG